MGDVTGDSPEAVEHIGFVLRLAYQRASANLSDAIGDSGITPTQFQTLRRLAQRGELAQNELGRSVGMPPANIHRTVRQLLAAELVTTASSPSDARLTLVELTRRGEGALRDVVPAAETANALTLSVLTPREREAVMAGLWTLARG